MRRSCLPGRGAFFMPFLTAPPLYFICLAGSIYALHTSQKGIEAI